MRVEVRESERSQRDACWKVHEDDRYLGEWRRDKVFDAKYPSRMRRD